MVEMDPPTRGNAQADLTQPVPHQWVNTAATASAVPPLAFEDDEPERDRGVRGVVAALAVGALVAVALGAYGRMHTPSGEALNLAGFSSGIAAKAWLATIAFVLAIVQVLSAMAM